MRRGGGGRASCGGKGWRKGAELASKTICCGWLVTGDIRGASDATEDTMFDSSVAGKKIILKTFWRQQRFCLQINN